MWFPTLRHPPIKKQAHALRLAGPGVMGGPDAGDIGAESWRLSWPPPGSLLWAGGRGLRGCQPGTACHPGHPGPREPSNERAPRGHVIVTI